MANSLGLILANRAVVLGAIKARDLLDITVQAERSRVFDTVWVGDSLLAKPRLESVTLLSALAGITERVRLAVGCMATFVHRHPVMLAQQWASLDVLSGGRAWLALCLRRPDSANAAQAPEPARMGIASRERVEQFGRIRTMAREEGRDPGALGSALYHNINITEDRAAGLTEAKAFLDAYYSSKFSPQFVEQWTIAGPPKDCVEQLRAYFAAGLGHMALRLASWSQQAQLDRFLTEVAPGLGDR